ncbi:ABC transporter substrate-binding protein [Collinsella sp. AGMB00827]|uniref:ABC transporter substrate-binding protein n=1 Tax=Collinsella ureilytica TaxID=2869515 RepID=A0ABS7MJM7_9ACTN|nr:ABC transporter substrate-binding protein [Collinsella urealyticum]MBY4797574.1 ABC transporter substrate-binding protein [Collinsella urealyticum]
MKKFLSFFLACFVALTLGACGKAASNQAGSNAGAAQEQTKKTVVDVLDREVEIPSDVKKVVVTFNLEEYLAVAGEGGVDKLVGYSHAYWEGRREDAWDTYTKAFPQLKEIADVGYNDGISAESIISLKPDLVIMSAPVNFSYIESSLPLFEQSGIPVLFVDYHSQTVETHSKSTLALGEALGQTKRAKEIVDYYTEQMKVVTDRIAKLSDSDPRPNVYMEFSRGVNQYGNSWGKKMWGPLIATCGGVNIAYDFGDGNSVDVNPEMVIAANPDVVIFAASPQTDISDNIVLGYGADKKAALAALTSYENRDGWGGLNAVKNHRMGAVYHDLSRHIFDFAGVQMMAKMVQPELFKDIDPEANLKEFFERYMPVKLEGVWTVSLSE